MATVPALFMYPKTARAILDLSRMQRENRIARRQSYDAMTQGDFYASRMLAEAAREYAFIADALRKQLARGTYAQF